MTWAYVFMVMPMVEWPKVSMTTRGLTPCASATVTASGWAVLDPEQRDIVKAAVNEEGGFLLEIEPGDDGTATVSMGGVAVARLPTWRLLKAPEMPAADA